MLLSLAVSVMQTAAFTPASGWEAGRVVERVSCGSDARYSYALYLPQAFTPDKTWSILYVFDARGRARLALDLFKSAAERHSWIIVSSHDTRSDTPDLRRNMEAIDCLWRDTHLRLPLAPRRAYAAGFSGGARLACLLGARAAGELAGVFGAGGGFPDPGQIAPDTPFAFFGAVGIHDFNYWELRRLDRDLDALEIPHRIDFFRGLHGWPPAPVVDNGVDWLAIMGARRGRHEVDEDLVEAFWARNVGRARELEAAGRLVEARTAFAQTAADLKGLRDVEAAEAAAERLGARRDVQKEQARRRKIDRRDEKFQGRAQTVLARIRSASTAERESLSSGPDAPARVPLLPSIVRDLGIRGLRKRADRDTSYESDSARRRLESLFVGTSFYIPQQLMARGEYGPAALSLLVAEQIKPQSIRVHYGLACAYARQGRHKEALKALRQAVALGFANADHMEADPDLTSLHGDRGFQKIVSELRTRPTAPETP